MPSPPISVIPAAVVQAMRFAAWRRTDSGRRGVPARVPPALTELISLIGSVLPAFPKVTTGYSLGHAYIAAAIAVQPMVRRGRGLR
jgi:hypothetical protein